MTKELKDLKMEFAPGCFDNFQGTQEELDEMVAEIRRMFESGELFANAKPVTDEDFENLPEDLQESILRDLEAIEEDRQRKLN